MVKTRSSKRPITRTTTNSAGPTSMGSLSPGKTRTIKRKIAKICTLMVKTRSSKRPITRTTTNSAGPTSMGSLSPRKTRTIKRKETRSSGLFHQHNHQKNGLSRISVIEQSRVLSELGYTPTKENRNKTNEWLQFGKFVRFRPLYESAYQEPIRSAKVIYVCEFCLTHLIDIDKFKGHVMFCQWRFPPGNEIYRNVQQRWNIWEVAGNTETTYCRNLCLMAKLFLSSKTLFHEVETFTFYLLTEITSRGCVLVGYFSKEKNPSKNNNLSCLLTLPNAHNRGYGKLLIDLSYQLSKLEHKIGHPEHPLSDMGLMAYRSYWRSVLFTALRQRQKTTEVSIRDLSIETAIHSSDIVSTLLANDMLSFRDDGCYIDIAKALNAIPASLRRRQINLDQLRWKPPFYVNPHSSKMNSYMSTAD